MYYLEECSYDELAEIMAVPEGILKTWMHRARRQLRDIVGRELKDSHEH